MIADPWFYAVAVPALLLTGISKGGIGAGAGILSVPLMSLVIPPTQAAGIMLPLLCAMDLVGLWRYRAAHDRRRLTFLLPASIVGIALGTATFGLIPEAGVRVIIGAIAVVFVLRHWIGVLTKGRHEGRAPGPRSGAFWAAMSGYTSFVAHAGGPPLSVYLLPQRLDKTTFVATTVVFFAVVNYAKLVPYWALGQLAVGNLATSLALMPLAPAGMALGFWLHRRIDALLFFRICHGLLLVTGGKLLFDGLRALP
ncbi:MAG: sulfite exporter TauE/SafE family protein [Alphaproteobacteria bacterium]